MKELTPAPEFSAQHYGLLVVLLVLAAAGNIVLNWLFPAQAGSAWTELLPPLLGLYCLILLFRELGIIKLPGIAYYSVLITPLSAIGLYQFIIH